MRHHPEANTCPHHFLTKEVSPYAPGHQPNYPGKSTWSYTDMVPEGRELMKIERILADVRAMLIDIIGAEYALSLDIGMDTAFEADLELESIEFVKLAMMLAERYGNRVDFVAFLADKTIDEIIEMTVGDVVTYIASCLALAGTVDG